MEASPTCSVYILLPDKDNRAEYYWITVTTPDYLAYPIDWSQYLLQTHILMNKQSFTDMANSKHIYVIKK